MFVLAGAALAVAAPALATETVDRDQVRSVVREMLADAETRSTLLEGGAASGHDGKRFFLSDGTGNYRLNVSGWTKFRYLIHFARNNAGAPSTATNDSFDSGFTHRQSKIIFDGNFISPQWGYNATLTINSSGTVSLDDLFFTYTNGDWKFTWGQFKPNFMREVYTSDLIQIGAERSVISNIFGGTRVQGLRAQYTTPDFIVTAEANDGLNTINTEWNSLSESDYGFGLGFDWKFAGSREALNDFTSMQGEQFSGNFGIRGLFQQGLSDPGSGLKAKYFSYTADVQVEGNGFGGYAAFVGSHLDPDAAGTKNFDDFGWLVQGSYRFTKEAEVFARYEGVRFDKDRTLPAGSKKTNHFVTFGGNYYIAGQAARLSLDCIIALNRGDALASATTTVIPNGGAAPAAILPNTNVGLLGSSKSAETAIRLQWQGIW
jgi:hypothetical protein